MVVVAIIAPWLAPYDHLAINIADRLQPPSRTNFFGTDDFGRDLLSRVLVGTRISLLVAVFTATFAMALGMMIGLFAGYFRRLDPLIMRISDGLLAFPSILFAIGLMAVFGRDLGNVVLALSIVYAPRIGTVLRSSVLVVRESEFVEAARAIGAGNFAIMFRHILPNALGPTVVQGTFVFAYAILAESSLSYLGLGIPPPAPSWGNMLNDGRLFMQNAPWIVIFPGIAIFLAVLGVNLLGDGLRDALDPRMDVRI
jgi:peptide/nickel transport system permease protein